LEETRQGLKVEGRASREKKKLPKKGKKLSTCKGKVQKKQKDIWRKIGKNAKGSQKDLEKGYNRRGRSAIGGGQGVEGESKGTQKKS